MKRRRASTFSSSRAGESIGSARPSRQVYSSHRVTATPAADRDRIVARALQVAAKRLAANPLDNERIEADAAEWLGRLLKSDTFLSLPELEPSTSSLRKPARRQARVRRTA